MNILRSTLTCLIQTGESCCLRFVGDSRADVIRVHAFLPLWFQSTDPVPDWSCSSYSRVSCPADGRACFVRSLAGRARGEALRQGAGESLGSARGVESRGERRVRAAVFRCRARPWEESVDAYRRRLKAAAAHVNEMFDVDGLCRELPQRLKALRQTGGDRIAK